MLPVTRPADAGDALVLIDGTSAVAGLPLEPGELDAYYFAPQKGLGSDGGLWLALAEPGSHREDRGAGWSRRALAARLPLACDGARELPQGPDLQHAGGGDPAAARRPDRVDARRSGGLDWCVERCATSAGHPLRLGRGQRVRDAVRGRPREALRRRRHDRLRGFASMRRALAAALRANGIVDVEPYRKLGPQPAPHRDVPRGRARRRRGAHGLHRLGRRERPARGDAR